MTDRNVSGHRNSWTLNAKRICVWLSTGAAILLALSLAAKVADNSTINDLGITRFLHVGAEGNLPTAYSVALLAFASVLLFMIGFVKSAGSAPFSKQWLGLGVMFTYLAIDELAGIHELFMAVGWMLERLGWSGAYQGVFRWPWVIVGIIAVVSVGFVFQRFVLSLPRTTRRFFLLAATLFVVGAIGLEMLGGLLVEMGERGSDGMATAYIFVSHIEEGLEMAGVVVFIYALLNYARPFVVSVDGEQKRVEISVGC